MPTATASPRYTANVIGLHLVSPMNFSEACNRVTGELEADETHHLHGPVTVHGTLTGSLATNVTGTYASGMMLMDWPVEVTKTEREGNLLEVYALYEGRLWELKIDPQTGRILDREVED